MPKLPLAIAIVLILLYLFPDVLFPVFLIAYWLSNAIPPPKRGTRWYGYRDSNGRGFLE